MRAITIGMLFLPLLGCSSGSSGILSPPAAECDIDADCDDGLWCNGAEACSEGSCLGFPAVTPPCVSGCDEADQACTYEVTASYLAATFGAGGFGDCLAVGPPAAEAGSDIVVHPRPDGTLIRKTIGTARAGDVITFSQLFRQNTTSGSGQIYSCHFNVLLGQELTLIESGSCQTDSDNLECTITFDGVVIADI